MKQLLLVGSVPPPYHGQAVVTEMVFEGEYPESEVTCLNLPFSEDLESVGGLKLKKFQVLWQGVVGMLSFWWQNRAKDPILYYCAGSANWVPLFKDVILLGIIGRLFSRQVVHYHSGGLPQWFASNRVASLFGKVAYSGVTRALALTKAVKVPCYSKTELVIVPNGLAVEQGMQKKSSEGLRFLYLGSLRATKGVGVILEAVQALKAQGLTEEWQVDFVGEWAIESEKEYWNAYIAEHDLSPYVRFLGRQVGESKWQAYADADTFLFPSYYESENQPLVIIEAMGMGLPVITTDWRGIPELVEDGNSGDLIPPEDPEALAEKMALYIGGQTSRSVLATNAQKRYEKSFTKEAFMQRMKDSLLNW